MTRSRFLLGPCLLFVLGVFVLWAVWWLALDVPERPPSVPPTPRLVLVTPAATLVTLEAGPAVPHVTATPAPLADRLPLASPSPTVPTVLILDDSQPTPTPVPMLILPTVKPTVDTARMQQKG